MRLFICTPTTRGFSPDYMHSMIATAMVLSTHDVACEFETLVGDSYIPRARDILTAEFMTDPTRTHMMLIDDDIGWHPEAIARLVDADKPIACGVYRKKTDRHESYVVNFDDQVKVEGPLLRARDAGTGFMLVKREVVAGMQDAHPELKLDGPRPDMADEVPGLMDQYFHLWRDVITDDRRLLSEDYAFCHRAKAIGFDTWVDPEIKLSHTGSKTWYGDFATWLKGQIDGSDKNGQSRPLVAG